MRNFDPFWPGRLVIFATNDHYHDNAFRRWAKREDIPFRELMGKWKGEYERSFLIRWIDASLLYPWFLNQDSIFILQPQGNNYDAFLQPVKGKEDWNLEESLIPLGQWKEISAAEVNRYEGATLDPVSQRWFTTTDTKRLHRSIRQSHDYLVGLYDKDGHLTVWPVSGDSVEEALKEAWADFREMHGKWDNAMPPDWTEAHLI